MPTPRQSNRLPLARGTEGPASKGPESGADAAAARPAGVIRRPQGGLGAKVRNVADLRAGGPIEGVFLVESKAISTDRRGKPYLALTLADRTGRVEARVWEGAETLDAAFAAGDHVRISGRAQTFQGRLQLHLRNVEPVSIEALEIPAEAFLREGKAPPETLLSELRALVRTMQNPWLKRIIEAFLDDPEHRARFTKVPAAQTVHHAWMGGLLEHTLSVMRLADRICAHYPEVDRDLVLAGCFFHDYGKIAELSCEGGIRYTDEGRLVGHIVLCSQWLAERAHAIEGFPEPLLHALVHCVVAHHGEVEYGSPKRPKTREALLVHYADVIDARLSSWSELLENAGTDGWTEYNRIYGRPLFVGPSADGTPRGGRTAGRTGAGEGKRRKRRRRKRRPEASGGAAGGGAQSPAKAPQRETRPGEAKGRRPTARGHTATLTYNPFADLGARAAPEAGPAPGEAPAAAEADPPAAEPNSAEAGPAQVPAAEPAGTEPSAPRGEGAPGDSAAGAAPGNPGDAS